jgi:hypothetical protein
MNKEQLANYIDISFIETDKKRQLIEALNKGVSIPEVQGVFEDFLTEKINSYGDKYEKATADFESLSSELDKEIKSQEDSLDKVLDEKLTTVDRADYDARNKIWDEYYAEIDKLESSYEKKIKSIISKIIISA